LTYHLSQLNPTARFIGIDNADWVLAEARREFRHVPSVGFDNIDLHQLFKCFDSNKFDLAVCKQASSWLPSYETPMRELITVTQQAIFVSSLFYDGRIDYEIKVREHGRASQSF
jgi:trans-aconitate methyltransferase